MQISMAMALEKLVAVLTAHNSPHLDGMLIFGYNNRKASLLWGVELETISNRADEFNRGIIGRSRGFEFIFEDPKSGDFYCYNTDDSDKMKISGVYEKDYRYKIFGTEARYKKFMSNLNQSIGKTIDNNQYLRVWRAIQELEKEYDNKFLNILPQFIRTLIPAYFNRKIKGSKPGTTHYEIKQIVEQMA